MTKNLQAFSIVFLGLCILLGSFVLSKSIDNNQVAMQVRSEEQVSQSRYEFITLASDYYVVFDTHTGDFWKKIDGQEWIKQDGPQ